jgi:hypothetical protein
MKQACLFLISILLLSSMAACVGKIKVLNSSAGSITTTLDGGDSQTIATGASYTYDVKTQGFDPTTFLLKASGNWITNTSISVKISPLSTKDVAIETSRGELYVDNYSGVTLSVFVSPSSSTTWGSSLGTVSGYGSLSVYCPAGSWDLKVVDSSGGYLSKLNNTIRLGSRTTAKVYYSYISAPIQKAPAASAMAPVPDGAGEPKSATGSGIPGLRIE